MPLDAQVLTTAALFISGPMGWLPPIALGLWALKVLFLPSLRGAQGEKKVGGVLERLFGEVLHDIIIPDGRGGLTQLDHVALTRQGLLVVETKNYSGAIFGGERDAKWTQRLGGRSYRFQNPLRQNHLHLSAVRALQLTVPVSGLVVFTEDAAFPKGVPPGVTRLSELPREVGHLMGGTGIPPSYADAWERLKQSARTDKLARKEHLDSVRAKKGRDLRPRIVRIALAVSAVWLLALALWQRSEPPTAGSVPITKREPPAPVIAVAPSIPPGDKGRAGWSSTVSSRGNSSAPVAEIAWSNGKSTTSEQCSLATAAILIDNSAENQARRDRACPGKNPNGRGAAE